MIAGFTKQEQCIFLSNIIRDEKLFKDALMVIKPDDFDFHHCKFVWELCLSFYRRYGKKPSMDEFIVDLKYALDGKYDDVTTKIDKNELDLFLETLENMWQKIELQPDYWRPHIDVFVRLVRYSKYIELAVNATTNEEKIEYLKQTSNLHTISLVNNTNITTLAEDSGIIFEENIKNTRIPTGLRCLDLRIDGGLCPGELGLVVAPTGVGKTNTLVNFLHGSVMAGFHSLYVTLEEPSDKIKRRYVSIFCGIPADYVKKIYSSWPDNIKRRYEVGSKNPSILYASFADLSGMSNVSVEIIESNIIKWKEECINKYGINAKPMLVVIDYIDKISYPKNFGRFHKNSQSWELELNVAHALEVIAIKNNVAIWTAAQGTRDAQQKSIISRKDIAGYIGKLNPVTVGLGLGIYREDGKLEYEILSNEDQEFEPKTADQAMLLSLLKYRTANYHNIALHIHRGPTLKYWDSKADALAEQAYLEKYVDCDPCELHNKLINMSQFDKNKFLNSLQPRHQNVAKAPDYASITTREYCKG